MPLQDDPRREFALDVVRQLRAAGHEALWAGGCVRDALLGKEPKDYDVATDASPDRVRDLFGRKRTIAVGAAFGVITVLGPCKRAGQIEVATFREDVAYSDGRRPDAVRFTTAEGDAARRDFTINGLFYDPEDDRVIDYVGGRDDLVAKVVRAIGVPSERFEEDRLRMLRAVRFAASLGFALDETTAEAIRGHADKLSGVSPERIGAEVRRMLTEGGAPRALQLLADTQLLSRVLPRLSGDGALINAKQRLEKIESPSASLALAAALLGSATPSEGSETARRLKWTSKEWEGVGWLLEHAGDLEGVAERPWSETQPLLAAEGGAELVALRRSAIDSPDEVDTYCRERLAWPADRLDPAPLLVGADLIAAGLEPGPEFAGLLRRARAAQLDSEVETKAEALALLGLG